jgi:membrane protease YdiL (CAAX protease family)
MAKLSVGQAALEGVRLIGRQPASVLGWALAYFALALLPAAGLAWHEAGDAAPQATLTQWLLLTRGYLPWTSVVAWGVVYAAIYRAVIHPHRHKAPFLAAGWAELHQFVVIVLNNVVIYLLVVIAAFLAGMAFYLSRRLAPGPTGLVLGIACVVVAAGVAALIWVRLSMAGPMTAAEGRYRFFASWDLTRGKSWPLLGLMLLVILMILLAAFTVAATVFGFLLIASGMVRLDVNGIVAATGQPLTLGEAPWLVGLGLLVALLVVTVQCIAVAPWARAYLNLSGAPAPAPAAPIKARAFAFRPFPARARVGPAWSGPVVLVLAMSLAMGVLTCGMALLFALARWGGVGLDSQALSGWLGELGMSVAFDLLTVVVLIAWVMRVEKRPLASAGFGAGFGVADLAWFLAGAVWAFVLALGLGLAVQAAVAAATDPGAAFSGMSLTGESLAQAPAVLVVIVLLAFSEEAMFRGWLLSSLAPRTGLNSAIAISSLLFAAFHVPPWELADPARLISFLSYTAVGAGFAAVALGRGQIWSSTALHAGYNSLLAFATMAAQHSTPQRLWGAVSEQRRGSDTTDEAMMTLGLNLAIGAALFGVFLLARRRKTEKVGALSTSPA